MRNVIFPQATPCGGNCSAALREIADARCGAILGMVNRILLALALAAVLTPRLLGLNVKVVSVDHTARQITVVLPMHHAQLKASLLPEEPEVQVRENEFYEAEIESGEVNTTNRNILRIKIPDRKPVGFRLKKILFLSR